jgi:hypothetical protein
VFVEWTAVHVMQRWAYAPRMPVIPIFNVGLTPVAQMIALPPSSFAALRYGIAAIKEIGGAAIE